MNAFVKKISKPSIKTYTIQDIDDLDEIKNGIESELGIKVKKIEIEDSAADIGENGVNVLFANGYKSIFFKDTILILLYVGNSESLLSCIDGDIEKEW